MKCKVTTNKHIASYVSMYCLICPAANFVQWHNTITTSSSVTRFAFVPNKKKSCTGVIFVRLISKFQTTQKYFRSKGFDWSQFSHGHYFRAHVAPVMIYKGEVLKKLSEYLWDSYARFPTPLLCNEILTNNKILNHIKNWVRQQCWLSFAALLHIKVFIKILTTII